jgi:hypothetical protein
VTQANIEQTICREGWSATVRPPENYTEPIKDQQMAAYGDTGPASRYEEDHLIPLELGGSPTSPQNLWPEPGASPNPKDAVEAAANRAVCDGQMTLAAAQEAIAANWITLGQGLDIAATPQPAVPPVPVAQRPSCALSASYNPEYHDYDIYVHSDQPDETVNVIASSGGSATFHTDSGGYADVYLHVSGDATGQLVTATVGRTSCSTTLT